MKRGCGFYALPCALAVSQALASSTVQLDEIVVTGVRSSRPLAVETDPRQPGQPAPAADGAALLKTIPGMSVIRKGGVSGDPLLRGLGGSRLAVVADGNFLYGGCGGRMDPPTAYIYPDAYDKVEVIKGPQSVRFGTPLISGAVHFSRQTPRFSELQINGRLNLLTGSTGRQDGYAEASTGNEHTFVRAISSHNRGDNYRDGDGHKVHSAFERRSETLLLGLTPGALTRLTLAADRSRGRAAYADRMMDGSQFDRDAWSLKLEQQAITPWMDAIRLQAGRSDVDHIMDNFSLRNDTPATQRRLSNPDRQTDTASAEADLTLATLTITAGRNWLRDRHRSRGGVDYADKQWVANQQFSGHGWFAEGRQPLGPNSKWIAGWRQDHTSATYEQDTTLVTREQTYRTASGFIRFEHQTGHWTPYFALGRAERTPDYWERNRSKTLKTERNLQLDIGSQYQSATLQGNVSLFTGRINDFILIEQNGHTSSARNIRADRAGLEADIRWRFTPQWKAGSTLAFTWARNHSDARPLAQTPPLEAGFSLSWDNGEYALGGQWRLVAPQKRVAAGQGNIIGTDIGRSAGFGVLSLHAGWRISQTWRLTGGMDNVLNKTYAEHISKAGAMINGYERSIRVNEPGRTLWLKLQGQWH